MGRSCLRPDKNYEPQPNLCTEWSLSDDKLTWTFKMDPNRVWSDGEPITADDMVFTFQRFARPDYDFEWFYGMANIENWGKVVSGEVAPEELGVKKVDDYTFTIKDPRPDPQPVLILMADAWVVPQHVVKDRLNDGSWAFDPNNQVFGGPFKLESYEKGKQMVFVPNEKYTGPFKPHDRETRRGVHRTRGPLRCLSEQRVGLCRWRATLRTCRRRQWPRSWPTPTCRRNSSRGRTSKTNYLFFDTWNPPFDNLKVRQAFSDAIDREQTDYRPAAISRYSRLFR